MREIAVLAVVLSFMIGCGCGDDEEGTVEDGGTVDSQARMDSATDKDVGTSSEGGMDATNGQRIDTGFDAGIAQPPPILRDLNGTWFGPCYEYDGEQVSITLIFSDETMNFQLGFYDDVICQNRVMFIDTEMAVFIPEPPESPQVRGAYRLAFEVKAVTATVTDEEAVDIVNAAELFGYSGWKLDEPKAIDGRDFAPSDSDAGADGSHLPEIGDQGEFVFGLNLTGNQLQISDLGVGSLPTDTYAKQ
jgi:hypothetical protein